MQVMLTTASGRLRTVGTAQCTRLLPAEQLEGFVRRSKSRYLPTGRHAQATRYRLYMREKIFESRTYHNAQGGGTALASPGWGA
jgi:hypothetical protein